MAHASTSADTAAVHCAAGANDCDLLVIGSGAGGLAAAATAALLGLKVIVAEKEPQYGGTTAWSGGWMWVPRNPLARAAGINETLDAPLAYLRAELGERFNDALARTYLEAAPDMVAFFRAHSALQFIDGNAIPDFHGHTPQASNGGRSVCAAPFDGRRLGAHITHLKPPLAETTLWGMGIASGAELRHFIQALRAPASFAYVAGRLLAYWRDCLVHGRGMRLVNGNALVAGLASTVFEAGGEIRVAHCATGLLQDVTAADNAAGGASLPGAVRGARFATAHGETHIRARLGVVLACGGFAHDVARKRELLPHAPTGHEHWSAAAPGNTGTGLRLGESAGGQVATDLPQAAALAPVSLVPRRDGSLAHFPHLIERAKPGLLAVLRDGRRFTNEANSYHDVVQDLLRATPPGTAPEAWLICDQRFIRRYGLGAVKPFPMPHTPWLANGYLRRGSSLAELAHACGIDAHGLVGTVRHYNAMALTGSDTDFGKGETAYNRVQGDATWAAAHGWPNPCMAPLQHAPFYAVRAVVGSLGTFAGLRTNTHAQVLDAQQRAIPGLYATGNDMNSMMGGHYPSGGITLGPALTFGWLAARHVVAQGQRVAPATAAAAAHPHVPTHAPTRAPAQA